MCIHVPLAAAMAERGVDLAVILAICSKMADGWLLFLTLASVQYEEHQHDAIDKLNPNPYVARYTNCTLTKMRN